MSFTVFADGSANLPKTMLEGITLLPCTYTVDGEQRVYHGDVDSFDGHAFYEELRNGRDIRTSLLNTRLFLDHFTPVLEKGRDVIYVAMSSGISGTYNAAVLAARELMDRFKDRFVHIVDSLGCGFGNGLLATRAARLSEEGTDVREAARILNEEVPHTCQYFTVDDLNFLKRTGRVSGASAAIGTVLNIKPILFGDATGHIISCMKTRGRKKAIEALVTKYKEKKLDLQDQPVCISHGDCLEDAQQLADMVSAVTPGIPLTVCQHEPFSGSHVGPGMLALFFRGKER
ncbi:MAG: DegV family protein [Lachnospiraceae bacterium]|nr:DegV family protein [Lachnospiraceae bacterium]